MKVSDLAAKQYFLTLTSGLCESENASEFEKLFQRSLRRTFASRKNKTSRMLTKPTIPRTRICFCTF